MRLKIQKINESEILQILEMKFDHYNKNKKYDWKHHIIHQR